jgi:glutaredoxin-like protein NrdH
MAITVYSKPACVQCKATYHYLEKAGLEYQSVDISVEPEAAELVASLGYTQVPVVVSGEDHWSGFSPDRIKTLTQQ